MTKKREAVEPKQYSKVYTSGTWTFRYNYKNKELEVIDPNDKSVIDSQGLSVDNWNDNPKYWCDMFSEELDSEISAMTTSDFGDEFKHLFDSMSDKEKEELDKYIGEKIKENSTGKIYKCLGYNYLGQLLVNSQRNGEELYFSPEDVTIVG